MILVFTVLGLTFLLAWVTNLRKPKLRQAIPVLLLTCALAFINLRSIKQNKPTQNSLKYILTVSKHSFLYPIRELKNGQQPFIENKCSISNCYVTNNTDFFEGEDSILNFDAILFHEVMEEIPFEPPKMRSPHQIYVFLDTESADNQPMCDPVFDGFFNWTVTYKLDSDVVFSYVIIKNNTGHEVGPKVDMTWIDQMSEVDEQFRSNLKTKSKAVAWFVSHCRTRGKREMYVRNLKKELKMHNLNLDIYGSCKQFDSKTCHHFNQSFCFKMLDENYYFYLSFENSICEDYVTEKLNTALLNNVVPIVYGGANYTRFAPPGSYLDARQLSPRQLASVIAYYISHPEDYYDFFKWRNHYRYINTEGNLGIANDICKLCAALNDETKKKHQVYQDFRRWWNPNYKHRCSAQMIYLMKFYCLSIMTYRNRPKRCFSSSF